MVFLFINISIQLAYSQHHQLHFSSIPSQSNNMKATQTSILLAALAAGSLAAPVEQLAKRQFDCSGPYILAARGSGAPGQDAPSDNNYEANLNTIVDQITAAVPGATGAGVNYPATGSTGSAAPGTVYANSVAAGIGALKSDISGYVSQCGSGSKIVLIGYSQGAQVVSNVLGGSSAYGGPMDSQYSGNSKSTSFKLFCIRSTNTRNAVAAVALLGDPGYVAGAAGDAGGSTTNGIFAYTDQEANPDTLSQYNGRLMSWCTPNDNVCASGSDGGVHASEPTDHGSEAANFVIGLLN